MLKERFYTNSVELKHKVLFFLIALSLSIGVAGLTYQYGILVSLGVIGVAIGSCFLLAVINNPRVAFYSYFGYCFVIGFFLKNIQDVPLGLAMEALLLLTWVGIFFNKSKYNWTNIKNDHVYLALAWFIISFLEVLNPYGASVAGWFNELRFTALSWLLIAPLAFLLFNRIKDVNIFISIVFAFSCFACFYGIKQLFFGVSYGEKLWLDAGAASTHLLFGKLRVFSMYSDAGQFGASQAIVAVIALTLAIGPFKLWKRAIFLIVALILIYGMAISGTRGALFALVSGLFFALFLSKNFKVLVGGGIVALIFLGGLKYTHIGSGNYQIQRLRTALDPTDPSLNVRFKNQEKLRILLKDLPFGAGLGMSGMNGETYNKDKYIAQVPPDSYWVKVWVMYGVVGLLIWFCINCYIIGKCSGIVWNLQNPQLRFKMIALTSGTVGAFICSYGNEVMNGVPSAAILFMSWSFILYSPKLDSIPTLKTPEEYGNS